jgi:hypothetical protein
MCLIMAENMINRDTLDGSESAGEVFAFATRLQEPMSQERIPVDVYKLAHEITNNSMDLGGAVVSIAIIRSGSAFPITRAHLH